MRVQRGIWRIGRFVPAAAMLSAMCYLALRPSPARAEIPLMPRSLGWWLDRPDMDFWCNVAGYLVLMAILHATLAGWKRPGGRALVGRIGFVAALVIGLEVAQVFIPRRSFDLSDIMAGLLGVGLGTLPWRWSPSSEVSAMARLAPEANRS